MVLTWVSWQSQLLNHFSALGQFCWFSLLICLLPFIFFGQPLDCLRLKKLKCRKEMWRNVWKPQALSVFCLTICICQSCLCCMSQGDKDTSCLVHRPASLPELLKGGGAEVPYHAALKQQHCSPQSHCVLPQSCCVLPSDPGSLYKVCVFQRLC